MENNHQALQTWLDRLSYILPHQTLWGSYALQHHQQFFSLFTLVKDPPFLTKSFQLHDICNHVSTRVLKF
jgi:hypothetical protein